MMRRLGLVLLLLVCVAVAIWIFLLRLPDAPTQTPAPATPDTAVADRGDAPAAETMLPPPVPAPAPVPGAAPGVAPSAGRPLLTVPVAGIARSAIQDNWGDPRDNGLRAHHGTDIMAPGGTPVIAAAPGTVEKLFESAAGGTTAYVRSPGRRWIYYYAHLSGYAPGLHEGQVVRAGDPIGLVGDTGNAGPGNYHLHFGLARTTPDQHWYQGQDVDPFPYLAGTAAPG